MSTTEASQSGLIKVGQRTATISRTIQVLLLVIDITLIALANVAAVSLRINLQFFEEAKDVEDNVAPIALLIIGTWILLLAFFRTYSLDRFGLGVEEYKHVLAASLTLAAAIAVAAFMFQYPISRGYYLLLVMIGIPLLVLGRWLFRRVVHRLRDRGRLTLDVLVVGNAASVYELVTVLRRESWLGYRVLATLTSDSQALDTDSVPVLGTPDDLPQIVAETEASCVIFAEGAFPSSADFRRAAWDLEDKGVQMIVVPALTDISAQRLEVRPVAGLPLVYVDRPQAIDASRWVKRTFDILGATFVLLVFSPLMLVTAAIVKLQDGGPVFFKQIRTGRHGKPFYCFKFRSMVIDAEERKKDLMKVNEGAGALFKIAEDPRITKFGKFIRRFSIDELPQLFNVLAGQMSLVGPRPALPCEVAKYDEDVRRRLHVRPGLTGLWQVSGRSDLSWEETVRLDLYYVDNWSMIQDLNILMRTVGAVFSSRGAY